MPLAGADELNRATNWLSTLLAVPPCLNPKCQQYADDNRSSFRCDPGPGNFSDATHSGSIDGSMAALGR
jgi:hypothetical protein